MPPDEQSLVDIVVHARLITALAARLDETAFLSDPDAQHAISYRLLVIGEATKRLSTEFRDKHSAVAWSEMAGLRDVLVHGYHRVSLARIWTVVTEDIPAVLAYIEPLIPPE